MTLSADTAPHRATLHIRRMRYVPRDQLVTEVAERFELEPAKASLLVDRERR